MSSDVNLLTVRAQKKLHIRTIIVGIIKNLLSKQTFLEIRRSFREKRKNLNFGDSNPQLVERQEVGRESFFLVMR